MQSFSRRFAASQCVRYRWWAIVPLLLATILAVALPHGAVAQEEPPPELAGRVLLGDRPVDTATVVLHRVTADEAGPVDSVRVDEEGSFRFALPGLPGANDARNIYFASVRRYGVLYFGSPIARPAQLDSIYTVQTYEPREVREDGEELPIAIRNLFLTRTQEGWSVTDLFEVRNESEWTYVGADDGPVWRYPLPPEATNFQVGQGDLPSDAVEFADGMVTVSAPIPPGERLYIFTYTFPDLNFELPMPGTTEVIQMLISEPAPDLRVEGLERDRPVEMEPGVQYRRFAGENLADLSVSIAEEEEGTGIPIREMAVLLALLLTGAAIWAVRRRQEEEAPVEAPVEITDREELLMAIAALDEEFEAKEGPSEEEEAHYRERRRELMERLRQTE